MKTCSKCKLNKLEDKFCKNRCTKFGYSLWCKFCQKKWRLKNKLKVQNMALKYYYGIDLNKFNELLLLQDNCCAICSKNQSKLKYSLNVDHDHTTGKVRGLLCYHCNAALGNFMDSVTNLNKAIKYLLGYK